MLPGNASENRSNFWEPFNKFTGSIFWDNHALCHFAHSTAFSIHTILSNKACGQRRYLLLCRFIYIYINTNECVAGHKAMVESPLPKHNVFIFSSALKIFNALRHFFFVCRNAKLICCFSALQYFTDKQKPTLSILLFIHLWIYI